MKKNLSKSSFLRGLQCEKSLYLYKHHYNLKDLTSSSLQVVFDQGTNIGLLAQKLFPNGVDASPENNFKVIESVGKTLGFINEGNTVIYEASKVLKGIKKKKEVKNDLLSNMAPLFVKEVQRNNISLYKGLDQ